MKKILIYVTLVVALAFAIIGVHPSEAQVTTGSLTTTFASNNSFDGNMFDVTVLGADDVTITSFDINLETGETDTISVYYKAGTYAGFETNSGAWTLLGSASVTSSGTDVPTPLPVGGLTIPAGQTYGIYVTKTTTCQNGASGCLLYTNGAVSVANADIQLDAGIGLGGLFGSLGGPFSPRSWNGTVYYQYGAAAVTGLNVPHVADIRINAGSNVRAYDGPAGSQAKLANGDDIILPHDWDLNGFDTYVVTDTAVVDGVTWYSIFLGNEEFVWVNGSQVILQ